MKYKMEYLMLGWYNFLFYSKRPTKWGIKTINLGKGEFSLHSIGHIKKKLEKYFVNIKNLWHEEPEPSYHIQMQPNRPRTDK